MSAAGTPAAPPPGAWQDATGAWHYPYATDPVVQPHELAPVGPPRHYAPERDARDPRRTTLAAVLTFLALIVGLWAVLGFLGSMSTTLASLASGNEKLKGQLVEANVGLTALDTKTQAIAGMSKSAGELRGLLENIDKNMGAMLTGVATIGTDHSGMLGSLSTLDDELGTVNAANAGLANELGDINAGLRGQVRSVASMRADIVATEAVVGTLPGRLAATNGRLAHVNSVVNQMGCRGITSRINVDVRFTFMAAGNASIVATIVPPGTWGTKADGTPC
ncbi:MAG: hypothetical protein JWO69_711 [Thermoleophilia bacterium]|jgi:hypothetical protein|nr:hypothetical protein [Thermoleophilia bacterium]